MSVFNIGASRHYRFCTYTWFSTETTEDTGKENTDPKGELRRLKHLRKKISNNTKFTARNEPDKTRNQKYKLQQMQDSSQDQITKNDKYKHGRNLIESSATKSSLNPFSGSLKIRGALHVRFNYH